MRLHLSSLKTFFLFIVVIGSQPPFTSTTFAAESGCLAEAAAWITALDSSKESILYNHCRESCRFASSWLKEIRDVEESQKRKRTCNDLVLLWSHKECIYFRDYVDASAYDPCKSWTREMFQQCMAGNTVWFMEN